jgi:hypothetical protein
VVKYLACLYNVLGTCLVVKFLSKGSDYSRFADTCQANQDYQEKLGQRPEARWHLFLAGNNSHVLRPRRDESLDLVAPNMVYDLVNHLPIDLFKSPKCLSDFAFAIDWISTSLEDKSE